MSLFHALMRYKDEGRLESFNMVGTKKATIWLLNGASVLVYMADEYIIGEAEVAEAAEEPPAVFLLYNIWDAVGESALQRARRLNIDVKTFGAFGFKLDELNAQT